MAIVVDKDKFASLAKGINPALVFGIGHYLTKSSDHTPLQELDFYDELEQLVYRNVEEFPYIDMHSMATIRCGNSTLCMLLDGEGWNHGLDAMHIGTFSDPLAADRALREATIQE